jgi:hypothetical protein
MPDDAGWMTAPDTVGLWQEMWRRADSFLAPLTADYLLRHGVYARGVLWALNDDDRTAGRAYGNHLVRMRARG